MGTVAIILNGAQRKQEALMLSATADLIVDTVGVDNCIIIETNKRSFLLKNMRNQPEFISMTFPNLNMWSEKYLLAKRVLHDRKVDAAVLLCSDMNVWRRDRPRPFTDFYEEFESLGTSGLNYNITKRAYSCAVIAIAAMHTCDTMVHVFTDPTELRYDDAIFDLPKNYYVVHSVNVKGVCDYVQTYEPVLCRDLPEKYVEGPKTLNFTFAAGAVNQKRDYLREAAPLLISIPHSKCSFIGKVKDVNGSYKKMSGISQDTYFKWNAMSRFTLVIPSYGEDSFSLERFMEGLFLDCLPLILAEQDHTCNMQAFRDTFPQMADIAEECLMTKFSEIRGIVGGMQSMPEEWRVDILNDLKATDDYKRAVSFKEAESNWRALLGINADL